MSKITGVGLSHYCSLENSNIQTNTYISFVLMQKSWNKRISVLPPGQCACLYLDNVYMNEFVCINPCRNASKSPFYHD